MSQENVEIVRRAYEVNNSLGTTGPEFVDPEEVAPDFWVQLAPDVELRERTELPDAKAYRGRDEVKEFWRKTQEVFAEVRWEPQEFIDLGHGAVVVTKVVATGRGSDVRLSLSRERRQQSLRLVSMGSCSSWSRCRSSRLLERLSHSVGRRTRGPRTS